MTGPSIYLTGSSGYLGSLIQVWLQGNNLKVFPCSRDSGSKTHFDLSNLFDSPLAEGSVVIHCAYDFSLKAEVTNLNTESMTNLVQYCKRNRIKLILISSSSAEFPDRSEYARIKRLQECILEKSNFGIAIRVGILLESQNDFLRLVKMEDRLPVSLRLNRSTKLFYLTKPEELAKALIQSINSYETNFSLLKCYSLFSEKISFDLLQARLIGRLPSPKIVNLNPKFMIKLLNPLRRIVRINRLYNSLLFLCPKDSRFYTS